MKRCVEQTLHSCRRSGFGGTVGSLLGTSIALAAILGLAGNFAGVVTGADEGLRHHPGNDWRPPSRDPDHRGVDDSRTLSREPLYHGLSRVFIAAAIRAPSAAEKRLESTVR